MEILERTGIRVGNQTALSLLHENGCSINGNQVRIPSYLVNESIKKSPSTFGISSTDGSTTCRIGAVDVLFNPGSTALYFKDRQSKKIRKGTLKDCIELAQLVDNLEHLKAQSTALVPSDVPEHLSGIYRLYIILKYSRKPIITGAFRKEDVKSMQQLLVAVAGDSEELAKNPCAVFDCCPISPLSWDDVGAQHLIDCSTFKIPAELVPAPLMGATSPITIQGTLIQSNAEILSGVVICQLFSPGTPIIYGGAPGSFDMRYATPRFSSIEAILAACASSEIGKYYGLPTHAYLGTSDAKIEDSQSGLESGIGLILGALSRINIISGPGMLAQLNCQSLEKLVFDNEVCGSAYRLSRGIGFEDNAIIGELITKVGLSGDYLRQKHTSMKLRSEHFMPSDIICRLNIDSWIENGSKDAADRASERVASILKNLTPEYPDNIKTLERTFVDIKKKFNTTTH